MLKSIRKGASLLLYFPASTAAIEGRNSPSSFSPNGYCRTLPSGSTATLTTAVQDSPANGFSGRLMWIATGSAPGCLNAGSTTDPAASCRAAANSRSDAASDGALKSTSKAISRTPAFSSCRIKLACSRRGQGQTPTFSIEGASIATTTISPLASRCSEAKRRSASALRKASCQPNASTIASAITTRICGR